MTGQQLTSLEEAIALLLERADPVTEREIVTLAESLGRILAEDQYVPADVPPADNSGVDGYAVCASDLEAGHALAVSARIPAGQAPAAMEPGTAVRLFTGSEIPDGADAVVMQEHVKVTDAGIVIQTEVSAGQNIRRRGQDLCAGDVALARGSRIRPQEMGVLASLGTPQVPVWRRLRVAILNTGDELVDPGTALKPGQIYNSNRFTLLGLLAQAGCDVALCETLRDTREATRATLVRAAAEADLIITSGGVSVGEEDHVRAVLEESGGLSLWRLAIKPGKPLAFGEMDGTPVLGLPGNPASVLVTFLMVGLPYLRKRQGVAAYQIRGEQLPAGFTVASTSVRREFVRARKVRDGQQVTVAAYPNQSSGMLSSACWADGLAVMPEHTTVSPGDMITYYSFAELLG
ncbi:MAG: gephyrin-like molybdotransferase Glp [Marinobacter sp.]|uniref:molybdopterin molybdotransferase MoeA n=1 Tax=Marinobacter sp. TaxID=50741 RepID=UPI003C3B4504